MKKVLFLMVCALALTSCKLDLGINKVTPSDNIVTKTYKVYTFEEVNMSCVGHVEIVQNVKKSGTIELTAPDNYIEYYNNKRLQRKLGVLTPMEKHNHYLIAA